MSDIYLEIKQELNGTLNDVGYNNLESYVKEGMSKGQILLKLNSEPYNFLNQDEEDQEDKPHNFNELKEWIGYSLFFVFLLFLFHGEPDVFDSLRSYVIKYLI